MTAQANIWQKALRTDAQRTTANIPVGEIEELLLSGVFLLLSANEECGRLIRKLFSPVLHHGQI